MAEVNVLPLLYDIRAPRRAVSSIELEFKKAGAPINLTGVTVQLTVQAIGDLDAATEVLTKDITVHSDPANGKTVLVFQETDLDFADPEKVSEYSYAIRRHPAAEIHFAGRLYVTPYAQR